MHYYGKIWMSNKKVYDYFKKKNKYIIIKEICRTLRLLTMSVHMEQILV